VQEYDARKAKCSLPKEANLIQQKYMTQETAAQNVNINLSPALKTRRQKDSRANQCMDNSPGP
jgi:hypothetical protein